MSALFSKIRTELKARATKEVKASSEKYFKGVIKFHGLKAPESDAVFRLLSGEIKALELDEVLPLAIRLLESTFSEEKSCAIKILNMRHAEFEPAFLTEFEPILQEHVYDWGTSDSLSSKVFRHLIMRDQAFTKRIVTWRNNSSLWMQRMAAVSFVNLARHGEVTTEVFQICKTTIKNRERFVQLGTGWVLRELWLAEPEKVVAFIKEHYHLFTREALRYAIEKMPKSQQNKLLTFEHLFF